MNRLVADVLDRLQDRAENPAHATGVPTDLADFDHMAGLHPGSFAVVAALPPMGKTALAITLAQHTAQVEGLPVAFFSLETPAPQLTARMLCAIGHIDLDHLRNGALTRDEWKRLPAAVVQLQALQLHIDDTPCPSAGMLSAKTRRLAQHCGPLGLIVVDHLQRIGHAAGDSRTRATTNAILTRNLQVLARELQCPVIAF